MKNVKLMTLILISLFFVSCALGKNIFISKNPMGEEPNPEHEEILEEGADTESYLSAGIEKLRNQENKSAIIELKKALILDPGSIDAYYYLAVAEQRMGYLGDAIESYQAALRNDPLFYEARFNLATIYGVRKEYNLALKQFKKALEIYPEDADLHYNMAFSYDQMGEKGKAIAGYKKASQLQPNMVDAYMRLAVLYELLERPSEAMGEYRKVLKVDPDSQIAKRKLEELSSRERERTEITKVERAPQPTQPSEQSQPKEGKLKKWLKMPKVALAKVVSLPKKVFRSDKEPKASEKGPVEFIEKFRFGLDSKFVTQKDVSFEENGVDNKITSKRAIAQIGYAPDFLNVFNLKDTQMYVNLGSISMGFDNLVNAGSYDYQVEKAMSLAYGAGVSSNVYNLSAYNLGVNVNLGFLHYAPEFDVPIGNQKGTATVDITELQLAADTIYKGFNKFSPYFGLLYAQTSGSFESSGANPLDFDGKDSIGCRIGTGYNWQKNLILSGEFRLMDENALSLSINYVF